MASGARTSRSWVPLPLTRHCGGVVSARCSKSESSPHNEHQTLFRGQEVLRRAEGYLLLQDPVGGCQRLHEAGLLVGQIVRHEVQVVHLRSVSHVP